MDNIAILPKLFSGSTLHFMQKIMVWNLHGINFNVFFMFVKGLYFRTLQEIIMGILLTIFSWACVGAHLIACDFGEAARSKRSGRGISGFSISRICGSSPNTIEDCKIPSGPRVSFLCRRSENYLSLKGWICDLDLAEGRAEGLVVAFSNSKRWVGFHFEFRILRHLKGGLIRLIFDKGIILGQQGCGSVNQCRLKTNIQVEYSRYVL